MVKIMIFFLELILLAQKKRLGALNAAQKTTILCLVPLLIKSRKPTKIYQKRAFLGKICIFGGFSGFS